MNLTRLTKDLLRDTDYFYRELKSITGKDASLERRYCRTLMVLTWTALEGWINCVCSDFAKLSDEKLSPFERAFLTEKRILVSEEGTVEITPQDNYQKTQTKLCYVLKRFGNYSIPRDSVLWGQFKEAQRRRNALVHPKIPLDFALDLSTADLFVDVTRGIILLLAQKIYHKRISLPI